MAPFNEEGPRTVDHYMDTMHMSLLSNIAFDDPQKFEKECAEVRRLMTSPVYWHSPGYTGVAIYQDAKYIFHEARKRLPGGSQKITIIRYNNGT